ncbi:MAG: amidohydrolase family protein [Verrucomicrobia bacterium]|nr:amidohydrolase family protein [Verrucomicrobiota bacterium]
MKEKPTGISRRKALAGAGTIAATLVMSAAGNAGEQTSSEPTPQVGRRPRGSRLADVIAATPFVDTHEHLVEEERRINWSGPVGGVPCNDWALLFSHYLDSDLQVAGLSGKDYAALISPDTPLDRKWALVEPHWPAVNNTGYGQVVRIAVRELYGVDEINARTIPRINENYRSLIKPGFYAKVLREHAGVESCQVNALDAPFRETSQPLLLMQDISILSLGSANANLWRSLPDSSGQKAQDLAGWHRVIDDYFAKYAPYAVAAKTQIAYSRRLDFADVPAEQAEAPFKKILAKEPVTPAERKALEDHLFWYCVRQATKHGLPVKMHTGYYAGHGGMPLDRVVQNPADVSNLLRQAPDTTFVLMHIGYPCQEQMISLAKHYHNAVIDMCWAWIISPTASERFVRDFLVTAPANKLLTFGGDYIPVECVVGHAAIARRGLTRALEGLAADGWLSRSDAIDLVEPLMRGNARRIFNLDQKERALANVPWLKSKS